MYEEYGDWISKVIEESKPIKKAVWKSISKIESRGDRIVKLLYMSAEDAREINVKYKTWYQMYPVGKPSYGFSLVDGIIKDHPDYTKIGNKVDIDQFVKMGIEVVKIADQILL